MRSSSGVWEVEVTTRAGRLGKSEPFEEVKIVESAEERDLFSLDGGKLIVLRTGNL